MEQQNNQAQGMPNGLGRKPGFQGGAGPGRDRPKTIPEEPLIGEVKNDKSQEEKTENKDDGKKASFNGAPQGGETINETSNQPKLVSRDQSSWKDTDSSGKRAEGSSVKMIKDVLSSKIDDKKSIVDKSKVDVATLIDKNIDSLNAEKRLFEGAGKSEMVSVISQKISAYETNKELIQSGKVQQNDLNKLYSIFDRDNVNINQKLSVESKEKNYTRFIDQLNTFHGKVDLKAKKNDLEVVYDKEVADEKSINKAIRSIEKDLRGQSIDLKKVAKELSLRGTDGDIDKMNRLLKHAEEYDRLVLALENGELDESQKKGLILFAQSDEERHKYLTERLITQDFTYDKTLAMSKEAISQDITAIPEFFFKDSFGKMLDEEAIKLFESFAKTRSKIPGMGDALPTDDLDALSAGIIDFLTDEEKKQLSLLKDTKDSIYDFNKIKDETTERYLNEVFNEKEYSIDFQISDNDEFKNNELSKIDLMDLSDSEKQAQKDIILEGYSKIDTKLQLDKARLAKERLAVSEVSNSFNLNEDAIKKHSSKMSIYSLTADKNILGGALEALSYETLEGRGVGYDLGIDVKNIKDYTLVKRHSKQVGVIGALSVDKIKHSGKFLASDAKRAGELLMGRTGETTHETQERYKKLDSLIAKKANGAFSGISLMVFSGMEWIVNTMENSPKNIAALTGFIQKSKMSIFLLAGIIVGLLVFKYDPSNISALIELNSRMYSFANFAKDGNGALTFESVAYQKAFLKTSLLVFLIAIIVMYAVIIEIMSKYIDFLKNSDDKTNMEKIMTSIGKTVLFFLYFGLIFKLFI